jgi:7-cyano-7-deazaguanine synthase in queuosine biosynthesis
MTISLQDTRCTKCALPTGTMNLTFSEDGVCSLCNEHVNNPTDHIKSSDIEKIIVKIKNKGVNQPYDCIVGVSGGRDSAYLLWLLVNKHNLRCVAAYYRTPFTPEVIHQNVIRLVKKLNVPLIKIDISEKKHLSLAKKATNLWLRTKDTNIANLACGVCKLVNREVYTIAKKEKVSSIMYGSSNLEAFQFNAAKHTVTAKSSLTDGIKKAYHIIASGILSLSRSPHLLYFIPIGIKSSLLYKRSTRIGSEVKTRPNAKK